MWSLLLRLEIFYRLNNWCATGQFKHFRTARSYRWFPKINDEFTVWFLDKKIICLDEFYET